MTYANNPQYDQVFQHGEYCLYTPKVITDYHKSREVEATIQNIYSNAGATAELIAELATKGLEMINKDKNSENLRTNCAAIFNNLLYRTKYPVDSLCGVRMGAILTYLEYGAQTEPEMISGGWLNKKMQLAQEAPELYDFFCNWGLSNTASYFNRLDILTDRAYFERRNEILAAFGPLAQK